MSDFVMIVFNKVWGKQRELRLSFFCSNISNVSEEFKSNKRIFCRCSLSPCLGKSRTVRHIVTACLMSFLALLGSVSIDLHSHLNLLHTTDAALDELISCKTKTNLRLFDEFQNMRKLCNKYRDNETYQQACKSPPAVILPALIQVCAEMKQQTNAKGLSCSMELAGFCREKSDDLTKFINETWETADINDTDKSFFSLTMHRLLDTWGTVQDDIIKVKQYSYWTDVFALRLMVIFQELNHQLCDLPSLRTHVDFQFKWAHILSHLAFTKLLSERLNGCWVENIDEKLNFTDNLKEAYILDLTPWYISGETTDEAMAGSQIGIEALKDTQGCLLAHAVPALRLASRTMFSSFSMRICLLAMACLIYPVVLVSFKQVTEWIQNYARSLKEKTEDLKRQRQLAEDLLHQMLPKSVAKQLRQQKHVEAESYEQVGSSQ